MLAPEQDMAGYSPNGQTGLPADKVVLMPIFSGSEVTNVETGRVSWPAVYKALILRGRRSSQAARVTARVTSRDDLPAEHILLAETTSHVEVKRRIHFSWKSILGCSCSQVRKVNI